MTHQLLTGSADILPLGTREGVFAVHDVPQHVDSLPVIEGGGARDESVEDNSTGPHVHCQSVAGLVGVGVGFEHLRGDVAWGT